MLARRFLQQCEKKCYTDQRAFMFDTLDRAEQQICSASLAGSLGATAVLLVSAGSAIWFWSYSPWLSLLFAVTGLSALSTMKWSRTFTERVRVLKVALRNRMRTGRPPTDANAMSSRPVDEDELGRLFLSYAPGRDYLTAYDFARLHEGERLHAKRRGRGTSVGRVLERWSGARRTARLLNAFADLVVEEDRELVPAISKDLLRNVGVTRRAAPRS